MKKNFWYVYLFEGKDKKDILNTYKSITGQVVMGLKSSVLSNYFHGLIKPRDILEYCMIYQSIPL